MNQTHAGISHQSAEQLFCCGDDYFDDVLHGIAEAKQSIELESYIFKVDQVGQRFINALSQASQRGIKIRVLLDGIGSDQDGKKIASLLESNAITCRIYHPLPWQVDRYRWAVTQASIAGRFLLFLQKINQRDHRKLCIIDNNTLWTGSLNICAEHLSVEAGGEGWHDYGLRISGKRVAQIALTFEAIWNSKTSGLKRKQIKAFISNLSPFSRRKKYRFIAEKIHQAERRIWITSAYFSPSSSLIRALKQACQRGVDVRLIVPEKSDIFFFSALTATYYLELINAGVNIYEYNAGFLHAKALILDDVYLLGSSNFNHRSFLHDLELDLFLSTASAQNQLEQQFIIDTNKQVKITRQQLDTRSWHSLLGWIPRLIRYWL